MQLLRLPLLLLLFTNSQLLITSLAAADVKDTLDIIHDVEVINSAVRSYVLDSNDDVGDDDDKADGAAGENNIRDSQNNVLEQFQNIDKQIVETRKQNSYLGTNIVESISEFIQDDVRATIQVDQLTDEINKISMRYDQYVAYNTRKENIEINTLISFAEWVAQPSAESVQHSMERLHLTLFGRTQNATDFVPTTRTLLNRIMRSYEESEDQRCRKKLSPQQFLYSLYAEFALIDVKAYTLMEFSLKLLRVTGLGLFTEETELLRLNHRRRTAHALNVLRFEMQKADRRIWRCDPAVHIKGVTYDEVTRLLQGYIENEDGLNADRTCKRTCDAYQDTRVSGCIHDSFCGSQPQCSGRVHDCQFIESKMWVCQSPQSSIRRYEYIQYESGTVLGQHTHCGRGTNKVDSWWRWLFWRCSFCFCLCDEQGLKSDRYFNLRETVSDVVANKVVTGVRFVKKNRVFHLQIQQGQLLARGAINESTVEWKAVDDYTISARNIREGVDYHAMHYWSRGIDLAEVTKTDDKTFVVTGLRFRLVNGCLNLKLQYTKYDFKTGKLNESVWQGSEKNVYKKLNLDHNDVPTKAHRSSEDLSKDHHYLEFVNTGLLRDAAQTTIPFIDVQDVVTSYPVALQGIGIHHKGSLGFGGFVAPKIVTYDFSSYIEMPTAKH